MPKKSHLAAKISGATTDKDLSFIKGSLPKKKSGNMGGPLTDKDLSFIKGSLPKKR